MTIDIIIGTSIHFSIILVQVFFYKKIGIFLLTPPKRKRKKKKEK